MGFLLNYASMLCTKYNSPLTTSVIGALKVQFHSGKKQKIDICFFFYLKEYLCHLFGYIYWWRLYLFTYEFHWFNYKVN